MSKEEINIVWFKRDLRVQDHEPLYSAAAASERAILLYILDPEYLTNDHYAPRHWQFVKDCLKDLRKRLMSKGHTLVVAEGKTAEVFDELSKSYVIKRILSHQETGLNFSFTIDKNLKKWTISKGITWTESQQNGVVRGIKNRFNWIENWHSFMDNSIYITDLKRLKTVTPVLSKFSPKYLNDIVQDEQIQKGGETRAHDILGTFLTDRSQNYMYHISKPELSRTGCSRLSPHIAWGSISIRHIYHLSVAAKAKGNKRNLNAFMSRLRWHCHFIQKFEQEIEMEFEPQNKAYATVHREHRPKLIAKWEEGNTGIPMIDACMRCLIATGYLNFRMRAMLVSFLTHALLQDWRHGVTHVARLFTDFEPGIHYPQFQMQSSVTGINTIRIYNPVKQSKEHDPSGTFIKKWVPELAAFQKENIHEPWKVNEMERILFGLKTDYPAPIIDITTALKEARRELWGTKNSKEVKQGRGEVLQKHTHPNRKRG